MLKTIGPEFKRPPEAPVFEPTSDEFKDPLRYISKIRVVAEKIGMCRIKPPPDWQPPFALDVDRFKFTPRIQRLNEMEARTRVKLNFLDKIVKFWELQGLTFRFPVLDNRPVDLYTLHSLVHVEGGMDYVTRKRKWTKIASSMGYSNRRTVGNTLKKYYERLLYPYDIVLEGKAVSNVNISSLNKENENPTISDVAYLTMPNVKPSGSYSEDGSADSVSSVKEREEAIAFDSKNSEPVMFDCPVLISEVSDDPFAKYICITCRRGDFEDYMLLCDGCDDGYHTFCLNPPLPGIPKGNWRCFVCVDKEISKPVQAFGFEQARREYTLQEFGFMADQFKSDYFETFGHIVPTERVEKEFWRIVSSIEETVTVEYGADLHAMDHGSGFPTLRSTNLNAADEIYASSPWNLNNIPILEGTVFNHMSADISGMKVPWLYVGMCFSAFCWHNEDHWSYSINYLHWGEPKTWYSVPGNMAEEFENAMKLSAPELFRSQPDILHQLVTIMNPNILLDLDVPVYRTDQQVGEFVITFPRAYHCGFNQGYNFAEAVNFAPPNWLALGRDCITHYSNVKRFCVFSHDELVCRMASKADELDLSLTGEVYVDMMKMINDEKAMRKEVHDWGVTKSEKEIFEERPDDERQCEYCKTTFFLSAIVCSCSKDRFVCLRHYSSLCDCNPSKLTLKYRYTLNELPSLLSKLKARIKTLECWAMKILSVFEKKGDERYELVQLKAMFESAKQINFPKTHLLCSLDEAILEAEKCRAAARQFLGEQMSLKTSKETKTLFQFSGADLQMFVEQMDLLFCKFPESDTMKGLYNKSLPFITNKISFEMKGTCVLKEY